MPSPGFGPGLCLLRFQQARAHRPAAEGSQQYGDSANMLGTGTATNTCTKSSFPVDLSQNDTVSFSPRWSQPIQRRRVRLLAFFQIRLGSYAGLLRVRRVIALIGRCLARIEISVKNGGIARHEHMFLRSCVTYDSRHHRPRNILAVTSPGEKVPAQRSG